MLALTAVARGKSVGKCVLEINRTHELSVGNPVTVAVVVRGSSKLVHAKLAAFNDHETFLPVALLGSLVLGGQKVLASNHAFLVIRSIAGSRDWKFSALKVRGNGFVL